MIDLTKINEKPFYAHLIKESKEVIVLEITDALAETKIMEIQPYQMWEGRYGRAFQQINMNTSGNLVISQSWYNSKLECCKDSAEIVILNAPEILPGDFGYCQYSPNKIPCNGEWCDGGSTAFGARPCPDRAKFE